MTPNENLIFYSIVSVLTIVIVLLLYIGELRNDDNSNNSLRENVTPSQNNEIHKEKHSMIETYAAVINAIAVLGSFILVAVVSFKKSRRDRIDELKIEMQVRLTQDWNSKTFHTAEAEEKLFDSFRPKFKRKRYKVLYQCAFNELVYESRNEALRYIRLKREAMDENEKNALIGRMPDDRGMMYKHGGYIIQREDEE